VARGAKIKGVGQAIALRELSADSRYDAFVGAISGVVRGAGRVVRQKSFDPSAPSVASNPFVTRVL
jgi:hypothetical protein